MIVPQTPTPPPPSPRVGAVKRCFVSVLPDHLLAHYHQVIYEFVWCWFIGSVCLPAIYQAFSSTEVVNLILVGGILAAVVVLDRSGVLRIRSASIEPFRSNIPLWLPVLSGFGVSWLLYEAQSFRGAQELAFLLVVMTLARRHFRLGEPPSAPPERDAPIEAPEDDRFEAIERALRIASSLLGPDLPTIALVGAYGSGKSSVLNLVEYFLSNPDQLESRLSSNRIGVRLVFSARRVLLCRISTWGLDENRSLEAILSAAVARLAFATDSARVSRAPASYVSALRAGASGIFSGFFSLFEPHTDPLVSLSKIDDICVRSGLRLVMFIEDSDRNFNDTTIHQQVASLLGRLRVLRNISFVFAAREGALDNEALLKSVDVVEYIPICDVSSLIGFINSERIARLSYHSGDVDPQTLGLRRPLLPGAELYQAYKAGEERLQYSTLTIWDCLQETLRTPRAAKRALDIASSIWDKVRGEVDPDELLIISAIMARAPIVIEFVSKNRADLRRFSVPNEQALANSGVPSDSSVLDSWKTLSKNLEHGGALFGLLCTLFPNLDTQKMVRHFQSETLPISHPTRCLQTVGSSRVRDYLQIVLDSHVPGGWKRDQSVLKAIRAWMANPDAVACELPDGRSVDFPDAILHSAQVADSFSYFVGGLPASVDFYMLHSMASRFVQRVRDSQPGTHDYETIINGIRHIYIAMSGVSGRIAYSNALEDCIVATALTDLCLTMYVIEYWTKTWIEEDKYRIYMRISSECSRRYSDHPNLLEKSLTGTLNRAEEWPNTLRYFVVEYPARFTRQPPFSADDQWSWLRNPVLALGNSDVMYCQILHLLTYVGHAPPLKDRFLFDKQVHREILGASASVLELLRDGVHPKWFVPRDEARAAFGREAAKSVLGRK